MNTVRLTVQNRNEEMLLPEGVKQIELVLSRLKCKDVLLELVDESGTAKGKPLEKYLPVIKQKGIRKMRFIMNDFSTQPIEIQVRWK